ncbi:hypothetical protein M0805_004013 [Coniferiporia weirii]|nr:hypothetical protein M0805_004013 [Coniferiporia weirii]
MEAIMDRALALPRVTGVLVLARDSWLTISSRGALSAEDAPEVARLLEWTKDGETGAVAWGGDESEDGPCLHFHRASTHTLVFLRHRRIHLHPSPRAPLLRFGLSSMGDQLAKTALSASLFTPSCSAETQKVHRPSSWY